jgi:predicted lipoprotein with Yx(FWY)xxD motif
VPALLVAAASSMLIAGCGSSSSTSTTTTAKPPTTTSTTSVTTTSGATSTTATGPTPVYEVKTGNVKGLGTVLVDGQGFTLYLFVPDKQSGTSTCYGPCAEAWPPLLLPAGTTAPVAGPGVNPALLGTTHRTDGTVEVTYNKWPLYLWVSDSQPGQATGQGINNNGGLWYVLSPQGKEITATP